MKSRAKKMQKWLRGRACPGCGKERLIQRKPGDYKQIRCLNCGATMNRGDD